MKEDSNIKVATWNYWTPLHEAVECDHHGVVEYLINVGADPTCKNLNGQTPLDLAKMLKRRQLVDLFQITGSESTEWPTNHLPIYSGVRKTHPEEDINVEPVTNTQALRRPWPSLKEACDTDQLTGHDGMLSNVITPGSPKPSIADIGAQLLGTYPDLQPGLISRLANAQINRYSRLLKLKLRHDSNLGNSCSNAGSSCAALSRTYTVAMDQALVISSGDSDTNSTKQRSEEFADVVGTDKLPQGVPPPPYGFLSKKVECPICFNLETFRNLDSWIKHIYEDIQPYICTFSDCSRPLTYKRKAEWMRHENGLNREAARYICHIDGCTYSTLRRSNFIPHMNHVHPVFMASLPPHTRRRSLTPASDETSVPNLRDQLTVIDEFLVDPRDISSEPCEFCGQLSGTWREYGTHMSDHFKKFSITVLDLLAGAIP